MCIESENTMSVEDYLQKLDGMLKDKSKKDMYMLFIMVFGVIFTFSYMFFWESAQKDFKDKLSQIDAISLKINTDKIFLQYNPQTKIVALDKDIQDATLLVHNYKKNNEYIKTQIKAISSLIYDEKTWGEYLHSISINAQKYNMKIIDFTSKKVDNNASFGHMLDINVKSTGSFIDTLRFMNSLEQSSLVVDIHDINMSADKNLLLDLNLSVWGILY